MDALVERMHHELGTPNLCNRTMVGGFRNLLPQATQEQRELAKLQKEFEALQRKDPSKVIGRHMFFADCMRLAADRNRGTPMEAGPTVKNKIMAAHGTLYTRLSKKQSIKYDAEAAAKRSAMNKDLVERRHTVVAAISAASKKVDDALSDRPP